ncbi:hypothetical protein [Zestomonas carbonaria]|uniref:Uncharacterized protein n=1 Tax=Zestomonas carbonaria TaxID=2762745 RepID=A0A7U7ENB9_9GAMM|nr:hypothetical protein [Pseudomonas carbonaria]CAD5107210.1 hypothetical protein PSEWESI4_01481 [Pseudomonas carbonaria]
MDYAKLAAKLLEHEAPRSAAFLQGMAAVLRKRIDDTPAISPYAAGTIEDDAYFAGCTRGYNEFRNALVEANGDRNVVIARFQTLVEDRRIA